jgi:hypothetical protein
MLKTMLQSLRCVNDTFVYFISTQRHMGEVFGLIPKSRTRSVREFRATSFRISWEAMMHAIKTNNTGVQKANLDVPAHIFVLFFILVNVGCLSLLLVVVNFVVVLFVLGKEPCNAVRLHLDTLLQVLRTGSF